MAGRLGTYVKGAVTMPEMSPLSVIKCSSHGGGAVATAFIILIDVSIIFTLCV